MGGSGTDRLQFGPFEVDLHTHELWKHGTRIKLIGQPFEVLAILLANPGELVTRDALRERLWPGDTFVDFNHGLNAAVNKLREAGNRRKLCWSRISAKARPATSLRIRKSLGSQGKLG